MESRKRKAPGSEIDIMTNLREIISTTISPIVERLDLLERGTSLSNNSGSGPMTSEGVMPNQVRNVIMVQTPTKPTFNGRNVHPITFLENLERYLLKVEATSNELSVALECLSGDAENWSRIYLGKWENFRQFKEDFLKQYWGREAQTKVKRQLGSGKWKSYAGKSMADYFMELCSARRLTLYANEDSIVDEIMQHFPQEVRRLWDEMRAKGAIGATTFLINVGAVTEEGEKRRPYADDHRRIARAAIIERKEKE